MMRIFVAIEISKNEVINSIQEFQEEIDINAKPIEPRNLHFTLQFLGEVSEKITEEIIKSLRTIEFSSFSVNLKGIGVFPKFKAPRVIWIGTDENGGNMLMQLSKKVEKTLRPLGFFSDKPFKPHITIFRIKNKIEDITNKMEIQKMANFGIQEISSIKLKKSELTSSGPIYSDLTEIKAQK